MTAGVGGNTISFGLNFAHVNAIELDTMRTEYFAIMFLFINLVI